MPSYLKKVLLSATVIVSFGSYASWGTNADSQSPAVVTNPSDTISPSLTRLNEPAPRLVLALGKVAQAAAPIPNSVVHGKYKNGTYTGSIANSIYGNIQVQAVVNDNKLTDVTFLQYPNDRQNSIEINQRAMPILRSEALSAQSAQVDGVSGATDTADAFVQSLSVALAKAS